VHVLYATSPPMTFHLIRSCNENFCGVLLETTLTPLVLSYL